MLRYEDRILGKMTLSICVFGNIELCFSSGGKRVNVKVITVLISFYIFCLLFEKLRIGIRYAFHCYGVPVAVVIPQRVSGSGCRWPRWLWD